MNDSEKKIETKLKDEVVKLGGLALKLLPFQFKGLPDRICLLPGGNIFFAECKSTGRKLSKMQEYVKKLLTKLGFKYYKIDMLSDVDEVLSRYDKVIRECRHCKTEFFTTINNDKAFCNYECYLEYKKERKRAAHTIVKCVSCGSDIRRLTSSIRDEQTNFFCSNSCRADFMKKEDAFITLTCAYCGCEFKRYKTRTLPDSKNYFCSRDHKHKYNAKRVRSAQLPKSEL